MACAEWWAEDPEVGCWHDRASLLESWVCSPMILLSFLFVSCESMCLCCPGLFLEPPDGKLCKHYGGQLFGLVSSRGSDPGPNEFDMDLVWGSAPVPLLPPCFLSLVSVPASFPLNRN